MGDEDDGSRWIAVVICRRQFEWLLAVRVHPMKSATQVRVGLSDVVACVEQWNAVLQPPPIGSKAIDAPKELLGFFALQIGWIHGGHRVTK